MRRRALVVALAFAALLVCAPQASAAFGFAPESVSFQMLNSEGEPANVAGAHPDALDIHFGFNSNGEEAEGVAKDLVVELPPGLLGAATATPTCKREVFDGKQLLGGEECPEETRVGTLDMNVSGFGEQKIPLFNIEPAPGEFASFGANEIGKIAMQVKLRPGDLGATIVAEDLLQDAPVLNGELELWGVPADHQEGTAIPRKPLLLTPTRCDAPLTINLRANSWEEPGNWSSVFATGSEPMQDCGGLAFAPSAGIQLDNPVTDSPSGTTVAVTLPEDEGPDGRISSEIKSLSLQLPEGFSISPPGANGLVTCTDAQLALGSETPSSCPEASRVGTVELRSPLLTGSLAGGLFVGAELPGQRFRLFVVATGPGIEAKFEGTMQVDPKTGRVSAQLNELPQVPFNGITLSFDGGPYALLATPTTCGDAVSELTFQPYSGGAAAHVKATTTIGGGTHACSGSVFKPSFVAGSSSTKAGSFSSFVTRVERQDGEQALGQFSMSFPPGLNAALRGVKECGAQGAAVGNCPAASLVGTAEVDLGPGPRPVALHGDAYFTGAYKGDPFGMVLVFNGKLGPFNLGTVVVQAGLAIDSATGRLSIETEKLPQIREGIPLRIRALEIDVDRAHFMRNPTSCSPELVNATMRSATGADASGSTSFQVKDCGALKFGPKISMSAKKGPAGAIEKPELKVRIADLARGANLRSTQMTLPRVFKMDVKALRELCTSAEAVRGHCPGGSVVGSARAQSSLLDHSMKGSIYLAQPKSGHGLPEFWVKLNSEGIDYELRAKAKVEDGKFETELVKIPDVPLSTLALDFAGGKHGVLASRRPLCGAAKAGPMATFEMTAQNFAYSARRSRIQQSACGAKK